jgi:hypothetical protein
MGAILDVDVTLMAQPESKRAIIGRAYFMI